MKANRVPVQPPPTDRPSRWRGVTVAVLSALVLGPVPARADQSGLSLPAVSLLNELVSAATAAFLVYKDSDSGMNRGFPSGWFAGGGAALGQIHVDTACVYDPASANGCTLNPNRLDRVRGTVLRVSIDPLATGQFIGINFEEPERYSVNRRGVGYDLRGATRVCFDALSPTPPAANFKVQFAVAEHVTPFVSIPSQWTPFCFDLTELGLTSSLLSNVHIPFTIVSNDKNAPAGGTVLLDNIRFEPVPLSQTTVHSFPLANVVFGILPASDVLPGRVKIPPDQVLANLTTIYESAMVVLMLLATGDAQDAISARRIADAFVYALTHDNQGLPIPVAPDGSAALHNGVFSGDIALFNDQGPGAGRQGQVRLPGFSIASNMCGPSHFCLVLDGATGGNNAFVILALTAIYHQLHDQRHLDAAQTIGNWIHANLLDSTGTGYGGYFLGYPDEGQAKQLLTGKSIENNADIFRAFTALERIARESGLVAEADEWGARAGIAGDFVMAMFDPTAGRFYAGTVPSSVPPAPGITPDGPQRGNDVINTFDFLDAQTFTVLPLASSSRYRQAIDWRRPIQWMVDHFAQSVTAGGQPFHGFNLVTTATEGPGGVAWEFTGQAIVAMRFVNALYGESRFEITAQSYLDEIRHAQQAAPFTDLRGVVAATLQDGDLVPPYEQCLSTPFQCVAARVGLAATTWAIAADLNVNPFLVPMTTPGAPTNVSAVAGDARATVSFTPPVSDGGEITSYTVTSSPGNRTATGPSAPLTVIGLTNGTTYTFTVVATNGVGNGPASETSSSVTPVSALTITLDTTTAGPGAVITATIANGPANATDWVTLASINDSVWIDWKYLNGSQTPPVVGAAGATLAFTAPSTPGTYNVRFFPNNTNTPLMVSEPITVSTPATITLGATTVGPGAVVTATIANGPGQATDWVGLARTDGSVWLDWKYLNGSRTPPANGLSGAVVTFTMPSTPGTYNVRLFPNNTNTPLIASEAIAVTAATIALSATAVPPGGVVTATIADGPGHATDWVGLARTSDSIWLDWKYLNGSRTPPANGVSGAVVTFTMPSTPGTYNVRLFPNNTNTPLIASEAIAVTAATIALSATAVPPGGVVTATIADGPGHATDWVGLARTSDSIWLDWKYLNGSRTPPANGVTGATLSFTMPSTPGTYNLRLFPNNTNTSLMASATITVTPVTIALSATTVSPGAVVTVTITNGPGHATDWAGLAHTSGSTWLDWKYLNGAQTPPANGVTGATLTFTMPSTPGTYNVRFFPNNTNTPFMTSATITVTSE